MRNRINHSRRYRIHQRIKNELKYNARQRTVFVVHDEMETLPPRIVNYVKELQAVFGYNIQSEIR